MISCTEFIPLYNELFKYLESKGGKSEVNTYWEYVSDTYVADLLGKEVSEKGIKGCFDYWSKSLSEEACDLRIVYDPDEQSFLIDMRQCPSRGMLNSLKHTEQYHDYCGHCVVLYERQLKKYGISCEEFDMSRICNAQCRIKYVVDNKDNNN